MDELILPSVTKYIRGLLVRTDFILKIAVMVGLVGQEISIGLAKHGIF